jgi:hypothetical protein
MRLFPPVAMLMLVKGTSPWSYLIKRATQSPYSHVCFAIAGLTYEMDFGGYYSRPVEKYAWAYDLYEIEGMTAAKSMVLRDWCTTHKGAPYDYGKVFGQGLDILFHVTGFRSLLDSKRAMSCVEWCCDGLEAVQNPLVCSQAVAYPSTIGADPRVKFSMSVEAYASR